jgi:hypothetical protein
MKPARDIGAIPYYVICFASLAAIYLLELYRGAHLINYLIPLVGFLAAFSRWSLGPLILLATIGAAQVGKALMGVRVDIGTSGFRAEDALLCVAMLAYTGAHYRLLGLVFAVLPPDPRRPPDRGDRKGAGSQARSARLADPVEVGRFLLTAPIWALLGLLVGGILSLRWNVGGLPPWVGRLILLAWAVGIGLFVTAALMGLWKRRQHTPAEATLLLQDTLWHETRGDQRRIQRWLAWDRLRKRGEGH